MNRRSSTLLAALTLALACGPGTASEDEGGTDLACPLEGMFVECDAGGLRYCDSFDGALEWGPCVASPDCELGQPGDGCQVCELVDGVPTITGSATCQCEAPGVPVCEQTECSQAWSYACGDCQSFVGDGDCFSLSQGCRAPVLACELDRPCARVWAQAQGPGLEPLDDVDAAVCMLTSLRDGVVGAYELVWGEMGDDGWMQASVYALGDGHVFVEWTFICPGCWNFGTIGRTGVLPLADAGYFDDCLADPSEANLIACLIGVDAPGVPDDYLPPFTAGACTSLAPACP